MSNPAGSTANQLVSRNLERARRRRGWTQEQAAAKLEPYLGVRWSKSAFSVAERSGEGGRHRKFTADEIVAFARAFDYPIAFFFLPSRIEEGGDEHVGFLASPGDAEPLTPGQLLDLVFGSREAIIELGARLASDLYATPSEYLTEKQGQLLIYASSTVRALITERLHEVSVTKESLRSLADVLESVELDTVLAASAEAVRGPTPKEKESQ